MSRNVVAILAAILSAGFGALFASPAEARRPIIGISCGGGFFVVAPGGATYWINGEPQRRDLVHDGPDRLVGMAECGTGVVSVFEEKGEGGLSRAYFSPDCKNIGEEAGATTLLYSGRLHIRSLKAETDGIRMRLADGSEQKSPVCNRR